MANHHHEDIEMGSVYHMHDRDVFVVGRDPDEESGTPRSSSNEGQNPFADPDDLRTSRENPFADPRREIQHAQSSHPPAPEPRVTPYEVLTWESLKRHLPPPPPRGRQRPRPRNWILGNGTFEDSFLRFMGLLMLIVTLSAIIALVVVVKQWTDSHFSDA